MMKVWTLALALPLAVALPERAARAAPWVGTWSVAPQGSGTNFAQQTLRQIVHTSISGAASRIQLSNAFGSAPVTIADVHIAQRSSGSSIVAGSDVAVTFGGQSSVTIAVGSVGVSDSIAFPVSALSDVAVSFYLPNSTNAATSHQLGEQTNYVASGDVSGDTTLASPQTNGSYYFLVNLDVQNAAATGAVVTLGASITDGYASTQDQNDRWPNDLAARIADAGLAVGVLNQGISGNDLLSDGAGQSALHRFSRDAIGQPGVKWVIVSDDPINDLGSGNPPTGDQLIAGLQQLITSAHAAGLKYLCSTLTPFEGAGYWTDAGETGREAINAFIRAPDSGCDGIVDQDTATHDPANPTRYLPAYDCGDHLHPNPLGYQAIANAVDLAYFAPAPPPLDAGADASSLDAGGRGDSGADASVGPGSTPPASTDAGASGALDGGPVPEGGGGSGAEATGTSSGCAASPGAPGRTTLVAILAAAAIGARRSRRRRRP